MPYVDGIEACRRLRAAGNRTPILMLTAKDAVDDRVSGLEAGADDYLVKPFALRELIAGLRALMRRAAEPTQEAEELVFGDLRLDPVEHRAYRGDTVLELTRTEFLLLDCFLRHPRQVLTRSQLFEMVWGYDFGSESNSLGVYIGYLRRKTEPNGEPRADPHGARRRATCSARRSRDLPAAPDAAGGGSVALAIVLAFAGGYMAIRSQLRSEVDASLRGRVDDVRRAGRLSGLRR